MTNWPEVRLGDVVSDVTVGYVSSMTQEYRESGVPFLRSQDVKPHRIEPVDLKYISKEFHARIAKSALRPGDVVVVRTGVPGTAAVIPDSMPEANCADLVLIRPGPRVVPRFLAYYFNSKFGKHHVHAHTVGAVQQHFNVGAAREARIRLPDLEEQNNIAGVLGALDDKIDLNRRMNETLEATARALFESWFVDLDPVRAKAEGRAPSGMHAPMAALFPDDLEEAELGEVPRGWRRGQLGDIAKLNSWTLGPGDLAERLQYIEISDVVRGRVLGTVRYRRGEEPSRARRRLRHGDTAISTVRPERASYFLCLNPGPELVASTGFAVLSPFKVPWAFLHATATRPEVFEELGRLADGGAYPAIRGNVVAEQSTVIPDLAVASAYQDVAGPLFERMALNESEGQTLAQLRDALLPKLLSGELRVREAERIVERAV